MASQSEQAEDVAERIVRWFGFDDRKRIFFGPDYNQTARDLYEAACAATGRTPLPKDQPK
jgi:hypothetical protein